MSGEALELLERPDWFKQAACRGIGVEHFYLEEISWELFTQYYLQSKKSFQRMTKEELKKVRSEIESSIKEKYCNVCPVVQDCKLAGKTEVFGIWGGQNLDERFIDMEEEEQWEFLNRQSKK